MNKVVTYATIALALIFVGAISVQARTNSDIWLWLRVGKLIRETGQFPKEDFLSHTANGREWIVHGWGFGLLSYTIYKHLGRLGLTGLRFAISWLVFFILKRTARVCTASSTIFAVITCFSFYVVSTAWVARPHLLGALYLAILMLILTLYQAGKTGSAYFIPLLTFVWANTHASLPIAFALMLLLLGSELLEGLLKTKIKQSATSYQLLALIIPVSFLTSLINPYHLKIYQYFFKINSLVKENILEWLPLANYFDWSSAQAFLVFLAFVLLTLILVAATEPKRLSYFEVGLILVSAYLSLSALRHILIATLILTPILAKNVTILLRKIKLWDLAPVALAALCVNPVHNIAQGEWGIRRDIISAEAINFIKEKQPAGKMYNHFDFGSSLLWHVYPQYQTFIDGRVDMFVPDIYMEWLIPATGKDGWEEILEKYQVGWVVFPTGSVWSALREDLEKEGSWCLVFWDDTTSIILKRELNERSCQDYAYKAALPLSATSTRRKGGTAEEAEREYQRAIQDSTYNASAHNKLGMLYAAEEKIDEAEKELQEAVEADPHYITAYLNLATLYEKRDPQKSIAILKEAIGKNSAAPAPYKKLALIYGKNLGETKTAQKYLRQYQKRTKDDAEKKWAEQLRRYLEDT